GQPAVIDGSPLGQPASDARSLHRSAFPVILVGNHITAPSAAITSALRGCPLARWVICPSGPRTSVVGVRLTSSLRTRQSRDSASISTCATPSTIPATSPRICLVARHGAQKAEENCTSVARLPRVAPRSVCVSPDADRSPSVTAVWTLPLRAFQPSPSAAAATSAQALATSPPITPG